MTTSIQDAPAKHLSDSATLYDNDGRVVAHGVTVIDHGDTISVGRSEYPKFEVTITADRITSNAGTWEVTI